MAGIVLSTRVRPYSEPLAQALWVAGRHPPPRPGPLLIRRWITHAQDEAVLTPAWFIPVVGNIPVPLGGVPLGRVEVSLFAVGLVLWLLFFTIVMHRMLFVPAMSERSFPTLFVLLAPPSVGLASCLAFTGGEAGWLAHILDCLALLVAMLLASLASRFAHGAFFTGWWAMTFPADAWAGATPAYAHARPTPVTYAVASAALGVATAIVAVVGRRTLRAVASGAAFRED